MKSNTRILNMMFHDTQVEHGDKPGNTSKTDFDTRYICCNCGEKGMKLFYRTADVPVHSCMMLNDQQDAQSFLRRPIELGFCRTCGFVSNVVFDRSVHNYAEQYEDQQSFSGRFRKFQSKLIQRLIEQYHLRGKHILEVGCGKGDFLIELCRKAGGCGVGIDPRSEHMDGDPAGKIKFLPELFGAQHGQLPCDMLCCRHTLEHLPETDRFVAQVRHALDDKPHARVFFEVPDAGRIWREQAFWDVHYEHCSYFTTNSLAEVFRRNRFEVLEMDLVFGSQYLILVARPVATRSFRRMQAEREPAALEQDLAEFSRGVDATIARWCERVTNWYDAGQRIAVWGAGSKCVSLLSSVNCDDAIDRVVDINPHQQGKFLPGTGKLIVSPEALLERRPDVVLVMNAIYREEISKQLAQMGLKPEIVCM